MNDTLNENIRSMAWFLKGKTHFKAHLSFYIFCILWASSNSNASGSLFFSFTRPEALNRALPLRAVPSGSVSHFCEQEIWLKLGAYGQALSQPASSSACLRAVRHQMLPASAFLQKRLSNPCLLG